MTHELTHLDRDGSARMVDVTQKPVTVRKAVAEGSISLSAQVIGQLERLKKGNAFEVARLAGISAAKKTWDLILFAIRWH